MKQISEEQADFLAVFIPTTIVSIPVVIFAFFFGYNQGKVAHSLLRDTQSSVERCSEENHLRSGIVEMTKLTYSISFADAIFNNWSEEKSAKSKQISEFCKKQAKELGYDTSKKGVFGLSAEVKGSKYR